jgi:hypothetical protein
MQERLSRSLYLSLCQSVEAYPVYHPGLPRLSYPECITRNKLLLPTTARKTAKLLSDNGTTYATDYTVNFEQLGA